MNRVEGLVGLVVGFVFGTGLMISGMTNPAKIIGFLDITGVWDPSLMFVMVGAIAAAFPAFFYARRHGRTFSKKPLTLPARSPITRNLIGGSVVFGIGWGLSGFCPGPAIVALTFGDPRVWVFVAAMAAGMAGGELALRPSAEEASFKL